MGKPGRKDSQLINTNASTKIRGIEIAILRYQSRKYNWATSENVVAGVETKRYSRQLEAIFGSCSRGLVVLVQYFGVGFPLMVEMDPNVFAYFVMEGNRQTHGLFMDDFWPCVHWE